jgi:hypothetical protein
VKTLDIVVIWQNPIWVGVFHVDTGAVLIHVMRIKFSNFF